MVLLIECVHDIDYR